MLGVDILGLIFCSNKGLQYINIPHKAIKGLLKKYPSVYKNIQKAIEEVKEQEPKLKPLSSQI